MRRDTKSFFVPMKPTSGPLRKPGGGIEIIEVLGATIPVKATGRVTFTLLESMQKSLATLSRSKHWPEGAPRWAARWTHGFVAGCRTLPLVPEDGRGCPTRIWDLGEHSTCPSIS